MPENIAFIGLGLMGSRMAARLIDAGHNVAVYNRSQGPARRLAELGATIAECPREAAVDAEVAVTMLSDDTAVRALAYGDDGFLAGLRPGSTYIDMSSISPDTSREIARAARDRGIDMLDAPVSGSTPAAELGMLLVMVGGDRAVFDRRKHLLETIGKPVVYMGESGAGATMKLVVNTLLGVHIQALGEAMALGEKAGLDKDLLLDVLAQTAVVSPAQKAKMDNARKNEYPTQFPARHMQKDLGLVLKLAAAHGVPMPSTAAAHQMSSIEVGRGGDEDFSAVLRLMEDLSGLPTERP